VNGTPGPVDQLLHRGRRRALALVEALSEPGEAGAVPVRRRDVEVAQRLEVARAPVRTPPTPGEDRSVGGVEELLVGLLDEVVLERRGEGDVGDDERQRHEQEAEEDAAAQRHQSTRSE
jgi:hypothetical protein